MPSRIEAALEIAVQRYVAIYKAQQAAAAAEGAMSQEHKRAMYEAAADAGDFSAFEAMHGEEEVQRQIHLSVQRIRKQEGA